MNDTEQKTKCHICKRIFSNAAGLRMHHLRVHSGKGWNTSPNFHHKQQSREEQMERRREYQRRLRERYKREGRDSRGYPRNKTAKGGVRWSAAQRASFSRTMAEKHMKRLERARAGFQPIVFRKEDEPKPNIRKAHYCPYCGEDVSIIL